MASPFPVASQPTTSVAGSSEWCMTGRRRAAVTDLYVECDGLSDSAERGDRMAVAARDALCEVGI